MSCAPYAASTFHRAPPEVSGFGVSTSTPGLIRSFQLLMCFGFPLRTTITTTERVTIPLYLFAFQFFATSPALTSVCTSGSSERSTTSAGRPLTTACAWSPDGPYDCVKDTPWPAGVFWKAGMIVENAAFGVE